MERGASLHWPPEADNFFHTVQRSRVTRASVTRVLACACLTIVATARAARAAEPSPGGPALRQARAAWEKNSLADSETLYREAIERGGLAPDEVLEGYIRIGAARASIGKKDQAVAAFRAASILDAELPVPSE